MDFDFTEDQVMLRNLVREYLTEQTPVAHVRQMMEDDLGYDRDIYRGLMGLGVTHLPEAYGGGGLGMIEQAIILEEMGRVTYPGPWFATVTLAGTAIMYSGDENAMARYLPDASTGDLVMTLAFLEESLAWSPEAISLAARKDGDEFVLSGTKRFVPFGHAADVILVAARTGSGSGPDGISLIAVPRDSSGITVTSTPLLDLTSKTATIDFQDVRVPAENLVGAEGNAWPALETTLRLAAIGAAAEQLGASRKSLEMSSDYAKVRKQFGQFIGQFQAVKHKLAEMLEQVENSHAAVYYAAWAQDAGAPDSALAASVAKATLNESSKSVCGEAIQVHGGIGYTWEYDLHLYWKRAKYYEPLFGDTTFHRERVLQESFAAWQKEAAAT